jgi:hypothetical protein
VQRLKTYGQWPHHTGHKRTRATSSNRRSHRDPWLDDEGKPTGKFEDKVIEEGELGYLKWLARYHPGHFAALYGRLMPHDLNLKTETKVKVKYETVEEVRARLLERGFSLLCSQFPLRQYE